MDNYYLAHHGIKGQHWGIRRFQDENGILTEEGKRRYGVTDTGTGGNKNRMTSKAEAENGEKKKSIAKKVAVAVGATALAAGAAYLAYKKATKIRDVMRSEASKKAKEWFGVNIDATVAYTKESSKAKQHAKAEQFALRKNSKYSSFKIESPLDAKQHAMEKQFYMREARRSKQIANISDEQYKKWKNAAQTITRRDAVKNYVKNKGKIAFTHDNWYQSGLSKKR